MTLSFHFSLHLVDNENDAFPSNAPSGTLHVQQKAGQAPLGWAPWLLLELSCTCCLSFIQKGVASLFQMLFLLHDVAVLALFW